jgi:hypothetical protein
MDCCLDLTVVTLVLSLMCLDRTAQRLVLTSVTLCRAAKRLGSVAQRLFLSVGCLDLEDLHTDRLAVTTGGSVGCHGMTVSRLALTFVTLCSSVGRSVL